jgi:hypothetical protein
LGSSKKERVIKRRRGARVWRESAVEGSKKVVG